MPRLPRTALLLSAGVLSAGLLGLSGTGTISALMAQVTTSPNTVALGRLALEVTSPTGTCLSTDGSDNTSTCSTVQPLSGRTDLIPGTSVSTAVQAYNRGGLTPSRFTLATGACEATGAIAAPTTQAAKDDVCSRISISVVTTGVSITKSAADLANQSIDLPIPSKNGGAITVTFTATPSDQLDNAYQGLGVSMPMTWTFTQ